MSDLNGTPYGVVPAVNELVAKSGWRVVGFALQPCIFCDVAIRRVTKCLRIRTRWPVASQMRSLETSADFNSLRAASRLVNQQSVAAQDSTPGRSQLVNWNWMPFTLWLVLLFAVSYAAFYPGLLNADSVDQLSQSLTHQYRDWHSPLMSAVWSLLNRIYVGPTLMLLLEQASFYLATFIFASIVFSRSLLKYLWVTALVFYPPILNILGLVSCDGFCVPIVFLGYAFALKSLTSHSSAGRWLNLLSQALLMISIAVRRECVMAAAAALFVLDASLIGGISQRLRRFNLRITLLSLCGAIITVITSLVAIQAFNYQLIDARRTFPYQPTLLYDLIALSVRDQTNYVPDAFNREPITIADLEHKFDPATGDSIIFDGTRRSITLSYNPVSVAQLRRAWRSAISGHWREYISDRLTLAIYLLGIRTARLPRSQFDSEQRTFSYFKDLQDVNAAFKPNAITRFYDRVSQLTFSWPVYQGWFYELILLVCLCLHSRALVTRKVYAPMAMIGAALAAGGLMQTVLLFIAAPSPLFRYLDWPMLASILSLTLMLRVIVERVESQDSLRA
jgi:hypothetical protein